MIQVVKNLLDKSKYGLKCPYAMTPEVIVVHNTANDAAAKNEIQYMITNDNQVSFHYAIDDTEVVQGLLESRNGWHAGDGGSGKGNRKGIAIEICYSKSGGPKFEAAEKLAAKFIAQKLTEYGWGISAVTKHQDYSGKYCPHRTLDLGWDRFVAMISDELIAKTPIITKTSSTVAQAQAWAKSKKASQEFIDLAPLFYQIAAEAGVNATGAYAQSAKETGYGNFGGVLDATYHNPCGMKRSEGGGNYDPNAHMIFDDWEQGITAQIDHLGLYAGANGYPKTRTPDPRHFAYIKGVAPSWEDLGGRWAGSKTYGSDIVAMMKDIEAMIVETVPEKDPKDDQIAKLQADLSAMTTRAITAESKLKKIYTIVMPEY